MIDQTVSTAFRPSKKYIFVQGFIVSLIILIYFGDIILSSPILIIFVIGIGLISSLVTYYTSHYEVRDNGVFIKKGLIMRNQSLFLFNQIQDVEEYRGFWDRIFGLGNLRIVTMSGSSMLKGVVSGLEDEDAKKFRSMVIGNINQSAAKSLPESVAQAGASIRDVRVSPYKIQVEKGVMSSMIVFILLSFFVFILLLVFSGFQNIGIYILGIILFNLFFLFISYISIKPYDYSVGKDWLQLRYKFLAEQVSNYRFDRIQNVVIRQSWTQKLTGVVSLLVETGEGNVYNSGARGSAARIATSIPALTLEDAYALKNDILKSMGVLANISTQEKLVNLRDSFPLDSQKSLKKTISFMFYFTFFGLIVAFLAFNFGPTGLKSYGLTGILIISTIVFFIAFFIKYLYEVSYFKNYSYKTTQSFLTIKKGVLGYTEVFLPYSRVQNVFLDMDIFDRIFTLRDVHLSTIGYTSVLRAHIDGISPDNAEKLKNTLLDYYKKNKK